MSIHKIPKLTPQMLEAALRVRWIEDFQLEFGDSPEQMREHIEELWTVLWRLSEPKEIEKL